jgi:hypothetical protein
VTCSITVISYGIEEIPVKPLWDIWFLLSVPEHSLGEYSK